MPKEIYTVGTFIEYNNKFLILHRKEDNSQGNTWGLPAGKKESGETDLETAVREIFEETGIKADPNKIEYINTWDWYFPEVTVHFPTFRLKIDYEPTITLSSKEHSEYAWITPEECYKKKDLIHGFNDLLEKVYDVK